MAHVDNGKEIINELLNDANKLTLSSQTLIYQDAYRSTYVRHDSKHGGRDDTASPDSNLKLANRYQFQLTMDTKNAGENEPPRIRKFEVGDLVFAKLKGYPPWPSKINQIESIIWGGKEKTRYNVYFYGTHQSSILRSSSLFHYDTYAKQIVEKWGRKPKFHDALQELERDMVEKMTYLNQLRTSSSTPDPWCQGFNSACESLVSAFDGSNRSQIKSKSHRKSRHSRAYGDVIEDDIEGELTEESRRLGYEVMYIDRIPFPDTPEALIIMSLNFNKEWVKEESERIKEEERMKSCFVRIEPLPAQYAHLDPYSHLKRGVVPKTEGSSRSERQTRRSQLIEMETSEVKNPEVKTQEVKKEEIHVTSDPVIGASDNLSDGSDEEVVETCSVCRLCFFSVAELKDHEKNVHGTVSTAESMFDRLVISHTFSPVHVLKEGSGLSFV